MRTVRWLVGSVVVFLASACSRPKPAANADDGFATDPALQPAPPAAATTPQQAPLVLAGLAAKVCPATPAAITAPLDGELTATLVPGSEPSALDPSDSEFHLYEGAVWLGDALYFSDFKTSEGFPSRILRYTPGQPLAVALADSGTNGLGLDAAGEHLVGARHKSKSAVVFSADLASVTDVAAKHQGKPFNSPNDLVFRSDGNLYFTDPDFQAGASKDQETTNVYRVAKDGAVSVVDATIANPNGISIAPDESALFVAGNLEQGFVKRYPLAADGAAGEGTVFFPDVGVPDGMVFDCAGNLYVTEHTGRRVRVVGRDGKELGQIVGMNHNVTNVAFGGADRSTLYITTTGALYQVKLPVAGLPY
jgi:gluconolactonase